MRNVSLACALVLATTSIARAQDAAIVDAKHYQVLIDNERTRVLHVVVGPGEKVPRHGHPDAIMIPLVIPPGPEGAKAPAAMFIPAQTHGADDSGPMRVEFIYVELKGNAAPTATVPANRPGITSTRLVENPKADAIRDGGHRVQRAGRDDARLRSGDRRAGRRRAQSDRRRQDDEHVEAGRRGLHRPQRQARVEERGQARRLRDRRDQVITTSVRFQTSPRR